MPSERSENHLQAERRAAGSNPVVGSSRKTRCGSPTSAMPRSTALLAAGERLHSCVALLHKPHDFDYLVHIARLRVVPGEEEVRFTHCQKRCDLGVLKDNADAFPHGSRGIAGIVSQHLRVSAVATAITFEDLDRRRLTGSVRAEEPEDLAFRDLEADSAKRFDAVVGLPEISNEDRAGHGRRRYAHGDPWVRWAA